MEFDLSVRRWHTLFLCCFVNLCLGSIFAWSVFAGPMEARLNSEYGAELAAGSLAIVFTIANSVGPIFMIPGGRINDLIGPKWIVMIGGLLFGGGYILTGFATSLPMLILTYSLMGGSGLAMVYGCNINNCVKLFPDKRGLVGGLTTACYGMSSVIVPPIANHMIETIGVSATFKLIGIIFLIIICTSALFMLKPPCEKIADTCGTAVHEAAHEAAREAAREPVAHMGAGQYSWKMMISTLRFWLMLLTLLCGVASGMMCISQASAISQNMMGMEAGAAALAVSVIALFNAGGRILAGQVSDRIGIVPTLAAALVLAAIGLLCLNFSSNAGLPLFYCGFCLIGLCIGTFMGVYPAFTANQFGDRNNSVNYGIMFCGFAAAGYLGPTIMYRSYNAMGSYNYAFLLAEGIVIIGLVLLMCFRKITK